ncbi:DUF805 domain-containing protein, partial [Listeria welshimeri]|nr:DUF805 domain-containing protein [Listeria welshimeri]
MGFLEAYKSFWKNYVNFSGRASRSAYWYATLWNVIIVIVLYVLAFMFGLSLVMEKVMAGYGIVGLGSAVFILFVLWLFMLAILLPTISLT